MSAAYRRWRRQMPIPVGEEITYNEIRKSTTTKKKKRKKIVFASGISGGIDTLRKTPPPDS